MVALDDFQAIRNPVVYQQLDRLLSHHSATLHLLLLTRSDPPLGLGRLRLHGDLVEIRGQDLHFTVDEAGQLMRGRLGTALAEADVRRLVERTEGWAAGLHLVALRLRDQRDPSSFIDRFTGADRHVVDDLGEEVLAGLTPTTLDFLLRTAVLTRLSAPLCAAVTGRADSARLLDEMDRSNLFSPLSQRQLAAALFVSLNTLKTHLRGIYRKLGPVIN